MPQNPQLYPPEPERSLEKARATSRAQQGTRVLPLLLTPLRHPFTFRVVQTRCLVSAMGDDLQFVARTVEHITYFQKGGLTKPGQVVRAVPP